VVLLIGSSSDLAFRTLAPRLGATAVGVSDLFVGSWSCRISSHGPPRDRVAQFGCERIDRVICRTPCVTPWDLPGVAQGDQRYVAREMTAALCYWLHALGDKVLNRPSPRNLAGEVSGLPLGAEGLVSWAGPKERALSRCRLISVTLVDGEISGLGGSPNPVVARTPGVDCSRAG
jgi:hypothetical protein